MRERVRVRARRPRSRRRVVLTVGSLALGAIALLAALDAVWVATTAGRELRATRDRLVAGSDALLEGRPDEASTSFLLAEESAGRVAGALRHPMGTVAAWLPIVGDDVHALRALAGASELAARAGRSLAEAAQETGWDGTTVPGLSSAGSIDTAAVARAGPAVRSAATLLTRAERALATVSTSRLFGPVREAVDTAREELASRARLARTAATLSELLPPFLGDPTPRRYLVVMQNLSDPRGSGGFPGNYAVLTATDGRIGLEGLAPTTTLGTVPPIDAPKEVATRYARFGALTHFTAATYPPDFPTSARLLIAMWEAAGRPPVDGVISVDPVWMSYVLSAVGPVDTPFWPGPITAQSVTDVLLRRTFETPSQTESNLIQGALGMALWQAILERPLPAQAFGEAMARAARERHLQVFSADPAEERALDALGASGRFDPGPNALVVAWDGGVGARTGFFAEKDVRYEATLAPDGSAEVTVTVALTNGAPTGPPSVLLGTGSSRDVPVGYYGAFVNVYLPPRVDPDKVEVRGGTLQLVERELGRPVVMGLIGAPAGGTDEF
ncbi:MAG TPA: DUF4012 domain-containing protein, partial [Longimicrobiales bacterium]